MSELEELRLAYAECSRQRNELLAKLKAQLQEPVAKVCHDLDGHIGWNPKLKRLPDEGTPLYASQLANANAGKPLTSEEIRSAGHEVDPGGEDLCHWSFVEGIRWAEKHHGIKE